MLKFAAVNVFLLLCLSWSNASSYGSLPATFTAAPPTTASTPQVTTPDDCLTSSLDRSLYCRGSRAIRNIIANLSKTDQPLVLMRGLEIVRSKNDDDNNASTTAARDTGVEDDSFLGKFSEYLRTHELNIKFSDFLADDRPLMEMQAERSGVEEGRKKDKGQGMMLAMAMMFGKMMAVMGMGGIGALAMKALGVAMAALMMAGIVGLKSLTQHGQESSHSVQYLTADGHGHHKRRRRRGVEEALAYRGWTMMTKGS